MSNEIIVDGVGIPISYYPDGSPRIEFDNSGYIRNIKSIIIRPKTAASFLASMFFLDAVKERGIKVDRLRIPFVPGSRQDRLTNGKNTDFLFTAKSMCKMINEREIPVEVFDPHSDVLSALLNSPHIKTSSHIFNECKSKVFSIRDYDGLISPDAGSEKKVMSIAKKFCINSVIYFSKLRDISTGKISDLSISRDENKIKNGKYIVIDDICDGGGTFISLAKSNLLNDVRIDLYITHGIFSKGTEELLKHYNKIICTDSVISEKPGITTLNFFDK